MPSLSVAICEIGRIVADWAISISDLGFLCWSSPRATPFLLAECCRVLALRGQLTQPSSTRPAPAPSPPPPQGVTVMSIVAALSRFFREPLAVRADLGPLLPQ